MIMPTKHLNLENSLFNIGAKLVSLIDKPKTISTVWEQARTIQGIKSYETFTLALDFVYLMNLIEFKNGFLRRLKC